MLDPDRAEQPEAVGEQGPLPDLLPHNEHPPRAANQGEASRERAARESEARRLGNQLRAVGDEYNAMVLRRAVRLTFYRVDYFPAATRYHGLHRPAAESETADNSDRPLSGSHYDLTERKVSRVEEALSFPSNWATATGCP